MTDGSSPLLELRGIKKRFGAVEVLRGIDLTLESGQVTALVGDNGAGKSTLIKAVAGIYPIDEGTILWEGRPVHVRSPKDAAALGIEVVYQDLALSRQPRRRPEHVPRGGSGSGTCCSTSNRWRGPPRRPWPAWR